MPAAATASKPIFQGCGSANTKNMNDHVYKLIELTGTSTTSVEDAVEKAIKRAHRTIKNLCWFQVVETRGAINKGKVDHWQVTIKVGFTVEG
jgi:flavin-binding protein dodecin